MRYINIIISIFLLFCIFQITSNKKNVEPIIPKSIPNEILESKETLEESILKQMSIEEKVGQLFIFGFDGIVLDTETRNFLTNSKIGGVLLLGKNIHNEEQLRQLIQDIQSTNNIGLFISLDQEGGIVSRIRWNDTLTTSQADIDSEEKAYSVAKARGEILKEIGVNMNLAPVVEYITNKDSFMYDRVYRGSKEEVYMKGISAIRGYSDSGIISVMKHYPGHSDTSPDSHYNLPLVNISNEQWNEYIKPFSEILRRSNIDGIMVGHIKFPNIDQFPSTISDEIINKRLIRDLGYKGLIISDDMEMDALENIDTYTSIAKQALLAGNDILIYSKYNSVHPTMQKDIYDYIVQEVSNGNMNIDEKVLKILRIKIKYNIFSPEYF